MLRRSLSLILALGLVACGGETSEPPPTTAPVATTTVPPPETRVAAPVTDIVGLDDPPPVPDEVVVAGPLSDAAPPPHGCVLAATGAQPIFEGASASDVLAADGAFVVASYLAASPDAIGLARIAPGGVPGPLGRITLEGALDPARRTAPPVLARLGDARAGIGLVDAAGGVRLARFELGSPAPSIGVVQVTPSGADVRYAPALAAIDAGTVVAWTTPVGTTAHVRVAVVDAAGVVGEAHDVTPDAGSAAAPVFDAHGVLHFVDARAGISVVHRVTIAPDGTPSAPVVAQPINLAAEPPSFTVVGSRLAYAAVGNAATRAVGVVSIGATDRPQALVPGLGYGAPLTIDAEPFGSGALFAMEAPSAADASAPHETRARLVLADGSLGDALTIPGATAPRIAVLGTVAAIVTRGAMLYWARCAE